MVGLVLSTTEQIAAQRRIDAQITLVASLSPGSPGHEIATNLLLLLQDALYVQHEIDLLTARAARVARAAE